MPTEQEADEALHWLIDHVDDAAQASAERVYIEEYRKVLKAQIMKEHGSLSAVLQEREAYADPQYTTLLDALREAVKLERRAYFMRGAKEAVIEAWRTACANNRVRP